MLKYPNNQWKLMKIANIDSYIASLHILWTTSGMSMRFSGKMRVMIMLKVREDLFLEKLQGFLRLNKLNIVFSDVVFIL